jgi:hypothetical protein
MVAKIDEVLVDLGARVQDHVEPADRSSVIHQPLELRKRRQPIPPQIAEGFDGWLGDYGLSIISSEA